MDSLAVIETQIQKAKEKRRKLILDAMDGRTQRSISEKTGIHETKISKWVNGIGDLEDIELEKLSNVLGVDFK